MIPIEQLRRYVQNCDPARPVGPTDPFYVDLDAGEPVRGESGQSCVGQMLRTLQLADPTGETCQLFTGFRGSGKTTELRRLAWSLEQDQETPTRTVYVDFYDYLDLNSPIEVADVLRVLAWCLDREATSAEGRDPDAEPGYLSRLMGFLRTNVDMKELTVHLAGQSVMMELRDNPAFKARLAEVLASRFQQFAREAQQAMRESVLRIRKATGAERVVVIADSLEKISPVFEHNREAVEISVESLFLQHARLLQVPCHIVYTFPSWLRFRTASFGAHFAQEAVVLPMVRVAAPDGTPYPPGERKLIELIRRRIDLPALLGSDAALLPIVRASGGYPRDLLRLVRELLVQARAFPAPATEVERVIDRLAEDYADVVRSTDLDLLVAVARTHGIPVGTTEDLRDFGDLIERWLVLTYRNGRRWYDLHPLVRRAAVVQQRLAAAP